MVDEGDYLTVYGGSTVESANDVWGKIDKKQHDYQ